MGGEAIAIKGPEVGEEELRDMDRAIEVLGGGHVDVFEASGYTHDVEKTTTNKPILSEYWREAKDVFTF